MSIGEVAAQLAAVLVKAAEARTALQQASALAEDATDLISLLGVGSVNEAEYTQVAAQWASVTEACAEYSRALDAACERVEGYVRRMVGEGAASEPMAPAPLSWADQQRPALPTYVTSGIYVDLDGHTETVQSGREPDGEHEPSPCTCAARVFLQAIVDV